MNRGPILDRIRECIAESLAMDPEDVRADSRLTAHLGADERDLDDILAQLEKAFSVSFYDSALEIVIRGDDRDSPYLTLEELEKISAFLPELRNVPNPSRIPIKSLSGYLSVESIVMIVESKLGR